jgi:hypothetical protein
MRTLIRFILVGCALGQIVNGEASKIYVLESRNNIFVRTNGETRQLTSSHRDFDPSITADGVRVVFARSTDRALYPDGVADTPPSDIEAINLESKSESVLFSGTIVIGHIPYHEYGFPQIDIAHNDLYLEVGDRAVFAVNLTDRHTRFVTDAERFSLIPIGPNAGNLIVLQRRWNVDSFINEFWVYSPRGMRLRPSSMDEFTSESMQNRTASPFQSKAPPGPR